VLIENADGIFTGLPGDAMRTTGSIRIADGKVSAIGPLRRMPGERVIDAAGCVIYPGLISTHHHLFQSVLKGIRAGLNDGLMAWLRSVPYAYWHRSTRTRCGSRPALVSSSFCCRAPRLAPTTIICLPTATASTQPT